MILTDTGNGENVCCMLYDDMSLSKLPSRLHMDLTSFSYRMVHHTCNAGLSSDKINARKAIGIIYCTFTTHTVSLLFRVHAFFQRGNKRS